MPAIGTAHVTVVQRLMRRLAPLLAEGRLTAGLSIIGTDFDEPEPDLCVLGHPSICANVRPEDSLLLIEVGDPSTSFDREVKLPRYL